MGMGTNGVIQGNFHEHPYGFYQMSPQVFMEMAILLRLYSVDSSAAILLKIRMPLEDGMMEQETSSKPSCSILLAASSILTAISLALGEYLTTIVLYIEFTSYPQESS